MHSVKKNALVGAVGILGLCSDGNMRNMTDTGQGFPSETICRHGRQIIKRPQLAGSESFTDDGQVFSLQVRRYQQKLYLALGVHVKVKNGLLKIVKLVAQEV
jgi:hypothetical protein